MKARETRKAGPSLPCLFTQKGLLLLESSPNLSKADKAETRQKALWRDSGFTEIWLNDSRRPPMTLAAFLPRHAYNLIEGKEAA